MTSYAEEPQRPGMHDEAAPPPLELDPPTRTARGRRRLWIGGGILVCTGLLAYALTRGKPAAEDQAEARDVPRVEGRAIVFSEAYAKRNGIKLTEVQRAPLAPVFKVVGTVTFDPRHLAAVGARLPGFVRRVFKLNGDPVRAGEPLAEIESAELGEAQSEVAAAAAEARVAESNASREAALLEERLTTAREAESAGAMLESHKAALAAARQRVEALGGQSGRALGVQVLRSPIAGNVVESHLSVGQTVEPNFVAFRVANLKDVWVDLAVFERMIGLVKVGDKVELTPHADQKVRIRGEVAHVGQVIDLDTRSADVRIHVDNDGNTLRPGQSVTARIYTSAVRKETLVVPEEAITYVDGKPTVFVAESPTRVVPTAVELGASDDDKQEILSGLKEGDQLVKEGVFALKSELFR